jgi:hypothetical protein
VSNWNSSNFTSSLETVAPISGTKSAKFSITATTTARNLDWVYLAFSCSKDATYKVSFKAKATHTTADISALTLGVKVVMSSLDGILPADLPVSMDESTKLNATAQSYDFTFSTTSVFACNLLYFNFGNYPVGTEIIIDDVVVEEVTFPTLTDGNICYGDFETTCLTSKWNGALNTTPYTQYADKDPATACGWNTFRPSGQAFSSGGQSTATPITGLKSYRISMAGEPSTADSAYMFAWGFVPVLGSTYTCTFKAKSSVDFSAGMKIMAYDAKGARTSDKTACFAVTSTAQTFTYVSDPVKYWAFFQMLCIQYGTLPQNATFTIDDVVLKQSSAGSISGTKQIIDNPKVKIYGNNGNINVSTPESAQANVYSLSGQVVKKQMLVLGDNKFSMPKGIYVVQIVTPKAIIKSTKVIVQ